MPKEGTPRGTSHARGLPWSLFVPKENKLDFLQLPVVHKLSISHDMPKWSVPRPVTGEGDLQGTSFFLFSVLLDHSDFFYPSRTLLTYSLYIRWTLGSALFLASFAAVMGPMAYVQHLLSGPRLPFTAAYFGSIAMTFYFALGVSQTFVSLPLSSECAGHVSAPVLVLLKSFRLTRTARVAAFNPPYTDVVPYSNRMPHLVPCQLLSYGFEWPAPRYHLWS